VTTSSRQCAVLDRDCAAAYDMGYAPTPPLVMCWSCGADVCRACSSIIPHRFLGKNKPKRFCFDCQRERKIGVGAGDGAARK
jgi:hypothetical protein